MTKVRKPAKAPYCMDSDIWPGAGKVIEETSELNVNLAKLIVNRGNSHYWGGVNLRQEIQDEIADSIAAINFFVDLNGLDKDYMKARVLSKLNRFHDWRETNQ